MLTFSRSPRYNLDSCSARQLQSSGFPSKMRRGLLSTLEELTFFTRSRWEISSIRFPERSTSMDLCKKLRSKALIRGPTLLLLRSSLSSDPALVVQWKGITWMLMLLFARVSFFRLLRLDHSGWSPSSKARLLRSRFNSSNLERARKAYFSMLAMLLSAKPSLLRVRRSLKWMSLMLTMLFFVRLSTSSRVRPLNTVSGRLASLLLNRSIFLTLSDD